MKKNNIIKILMFFMLGVFILSYIFPTSIDESAQMQYMPIWNGIKYILVVFEYFGTIPLLILAIGGLYGVLNKTGHYAKMVSEISNMWNKKSNIFIALTFLAFATLTSVTSIGLGLVIFVPLFISVILQLKYDKIVAFTCTFGAILIGNISSVFNYNVLAGVLELYNLDVYATLLIRIFIYVITVAVSILFLLRYAKEKNKNKKIDTDNVLLSVNKLEKNAPKTKGVYITLGILLLFIIVGSFPWQRAFKMNFFVDKATDLQEFEIDTITNIGSDIYDVEIDAYRPFISTLDLPIIGNYGDSDYIILILIAIIIIKVISKAKVDTIAEGFLDGAKGILKVVFVAVLIHFILIIGTYHPAYMFVVHHLNELLNGFNLFIVSMITVIMSVFNVNINMFVQNIAMILGTNITDNDFNGLLSTTIQSIYGIVSVVSPTSLILALGLSYTDINYTKWLKFILKAILSITLVILIFLLIWTMIITV